MPEIASAQQHPKTKRNPLPQGKIQDEFSGCRRRERLQPPRTTPKNKKVFWVLFDPTKSTWRASRNAKRTTELKRDIPQLYQNPQSQHIKKLGGLFSWEYGQDNGDLLNAMNIGVGNLDMNSLPDVTDRQPDAVYLAGDRVRFNHFVYQARWWSQNDEPGHHHEPWEKLDFSHAASWSAEATYQTGDRVTHNGVMYQAIWWALNNEPGAPNSPWTAL
ncbi:carbohydrate-binding protein [Photobacterium halotolerans]|uniref:carbohydrate-binding protein n=1 Tax=Photobacterium halotolerans TaxID=265726 RepID=UPI0013734F18|nr:carbohydrate-binding protein [Photobacterium halotolerans]NAW86624.1 hypothetical protein [Photobacterium halotolerans]